PPHHTLFPYTTLFRSEYSSMKKFFTTSIGRLRLLAFLEGTSLLVLLFIAVPIKYALQNPAWVKAMGPVHGALFLLFVFNALQVRSEEHTSELQSRENL